MKPKPPERFLRLKRAWSDNVQQARDQDPRLGPQAWEDNPARHIQGVACEGPNLQPCLLVQDPAHREPARRLANRTVDGAVPIRIVDEPQAPTFQPQADWGERNRYPGLLVGGKAQLRYEGSRRSGGTVSFPANTVQGDTVLVGCNHCNAPSNGMEAPEQERKLYELDTEAPFALTTGWKQITTDHENWSNHIDAALAKPHPTWDGTVRPWTVQELGQITGLGFAYPGDTVAKNGATTHVTRGKVKRVFVTSRIAYRWDGAEDSEFILSNLVEVENENLDGSGRFGAPGDSGSPVVKETNNGLELVGIHFAGTSSRALFCPSAPIVDAFRLRVPNEKEGGQ